MAEESLFKNYKYCSVCHKPLSLSYESDVCPDCQEAVLFQEVKDYIRANKVNEYELSEHFHLSHRKIHSWIREGRIEYVEEGGHVTIAPLHCELCGAPISFGTLCPQCMKKNSTHGTSIASAHGTSSSSTHSDSDHKLHYSDSSSQNHY